MSEVQVSLSEEHISAGTVSHWVAACRDEVQLWVNPAVSDDQT